MGQGLRKPIARLDNTVETRMPRTEAPSVAARREDRRLAVNRSRRRAILRRFEFSRGTLRPEWASRD